MISLETLAIFALLVILYYVNSSRIFDFRQWLFALYMTSIGGKADLAMREMKHKPAHVAPLKDIVSADPELRKKKQMRIVEFGVGSGQNLCDYPVGSQLILVDINDHFEPIIRKNCAKFPGLHLEKFYVTDAADMHEIPDGSVDAVVSQFALCSCDRVPSVLAEVKRILAPGGKYYFAEHVVDKNSFLRRMLQKFLVNTGFWGYIGLGCNAAKDTESLLRNADFSSFTVKYTHISVKYHIAFLVTGPTIFGVAAK